MRKKVMRVGMAGKNVSSTGKYQVNWGSTGTAYNSQSRVFKKRPSAVSFKNKLVRKFKPKYNVKYRYMSG